MKKIITTMFLLGLLSVSSAANAMGVFYTEATYPVLATGVRSTKPISELKHGTAETQNILFMVETGDAGIKEAARSAGIKQINFIDYDVKTIFFFFKKITTNVYGE